MILKKTTNNFFKNQIIDEFISFRMEDDDLEQERERLLPFIQYYRFATGALDSAVDLQDYVNEQILMKEDEDVWFENAFHDEEDDHNNENIDWQNVDVLDLNYSKVKNSLPVPLFEGSHHTSRDLARFILSFKSNNLKIGDNIIAEIVGMFASFLPKGKFQHMCFKCNNIYNITILSCVTGNALQQMLREKSLSTYRMLQALDNLADINLNLRTFIIEICGNGCVPFYKQNWNSLRCSVCNKCRWRDCDEQCNDENHMKMYVSFCASLNR
jgi:hypothetical protein